MHSIAILGMPPALKQLITGAINLLLILSLGACGLAGPSQPPSNTPAADQKTPTASAQTASAQNTLALAAKSPPLAPPEETRPLITAADLRRVASGLAADPAEAAFTLAQMVYQADDASAQAAAGELLRRAGVPLVATTGPVIGWPDDRVLIDAEVYVDFLPEIVDRVRAGTFFTPSQVTELLAGIFNTEQAMPPDGLVAFFAAWGKDPTDPLELRSAGAAVRALAAQRGQVFYPQADLSQVHIDLLSAALLVAQITSRDRQRAQARLPDGMALVSLKVAPQRPAIDCDYLANGLKPDDPNADLVSQFLQKKLVDDIKNVLSYERDANGMVRLDQRGEPIVNSNRAKIADWAVDTYNISVNVLSWYLLVSGAQLKLEADQSEIHYHHSGGDHAGTHVHLKATAVFASTLTRQDVKCYALAGLDIPPGGPMSDGFLIRWSVSQETEDGMLNTLAGGQTGKHVTTTRADSHKIYACGTCGDTPNPQGESTLELYTRTEPPPGDVGEKQEASVVVTASLDKIDNPFKRTDFIVTSKDDVMKAPALKGLDLFLSAAKRAGLPSEERTIRVTYHAPSIYVAKGERKIGPSFFYYDLPVSVDLYTCSGLTGPWQGEGTFAAKESTFGPAFRPLWGKVFGVDLPDPGPGTKLVETQNFMIDPARTNWVPLNTQIKLYGKMTLFAYEQNYYKKYGKSPPHPASELIGNPISGLIEVYLDGLSFAAGEELGGTPFNIFIEAADSDPHCPSGEATFGTE